MKLLNVHEAMERLKMKLFKDENGCFLSESEEFQYLEQILFPTDDEIIFSVPEIGGQPIIDIFNELQRAEEIHPNWPTSGFEALAIVTEELGELAQAMLHFKHEDGDPKQIRKEAIQMAAMGIRFVTNMPNP